MVTRELAFSEPKSFEADRHEACLGEPRVSISHFF